MCGCLDAVRLLDGRVALESQARRTIYCAGPYNRGRKREFSTHLLSTIYGPMGNTLQNSMGLAFLDKRMQCE